MADHDFSAIYAKYPSIIAQMPQIFTSHQFILELARQNQTLYVEALYSYRQHNHRGVAAPFLIVHGILAKHLLNYPNLFVQIRKGAPSKNIFMEDDSCSEWKKGV